MINSETTLAELQELGATTIGDIPIEELIAYVRNTCLIVAKDLTDGEDAVIGEHFFQISQHMQAALDEGTD